MLRCLKLGNFACYTERFASELIILDREVLRAAQEIT